MEVLIFISLFFCIAAGIPVFISLALVSFGIILLYTDIPLDILPQRMFAGVEGFSLLAIPFFMLASSIMGRGGITSRLIRLANTLVGHFPGGLAICTVLTSLFFAAITGSSASSVVAIGTIMYPALRRAGYGEGFSLGIISCSALLGMIIPPSSAMIIYGTVSGASIGALFMAGVGAGILFAGNYMLYCYIYARWNRVDLLPRASLKEMAKAFKDAIWGLGVPFIILGGIYSGVFTPTESAAISVAYAMFITLFVTRELTIMDIWDIGKETARVTARILIMVASATLFSWLLTIQGVTQRIAQPIIEWKPPPWAILFFANILMLMAGMFIDVFSNILIVCPLLMQLIKEAGISELHYGIITAVNSDMGNITPPFGLIIFITAGAFNKTYIKVLKAILPWLLIAILSLMIITYVPAVSMYLPGLLYPGIR